MRFFFYILIESFNPIQSNPENFSSRVLTSFVLRRRINLVWVLNLVFSLITFLSNKFLTRPSCAKSDKLIQNEIILKSIQFDIS